MAPLHPQRAIHALSLLQSTPKSPSTVHVPTSVVASSVDRTTQVGSDNAQAFWMNAAKGITWMKEPTIAYGQVPGEKRPTWFPNATLNTCYNALDRHVLDGFGDRPCFHHYSPLPAASARPSTSMSYSEVLYEVKALAGVLRHKLNVKQGDTVVIYFPMIIEGAIAMLACARLGAIHSVVFGGFAAPELAKRIVDAKPAAILAASCGIEPTRIIDYKSLVDSALALSPHKAPVLLLRRQHITGHAIPTLSAARNEFDYHVEMAAVKRSPAQIVNECVAVGSSDPLYVLYTSGTTASPKGVVRFNGGHAVTSRMAIEYTLGLSREDTLFCASDLGWVVGHSFCVYSPLLLGCASIIFEGKPILPDAGTFWKIVELYKVSCIMTAPTALRAIQRDDPDAKLMSSYNLSSLRSMFLAGERSEPGIVSRYQGLLSKLANPAAVVIDNYWSTESGSPITGIQLTKGFPPLAPRPGSAGLPLPGMDVRIVDDEGVEVKTGEMGNIVLGQPLAPSALGTVWKDEARFREAYFERFEKKGQWFDTGDAGVVDEAGYVSVLSRADDLINTAGHRLGTSLIESVVAAHPWVAECAIVGLPDDLKGSVPFAVVVRASSKEAESADLNELLKAINVQIRQDIGAIAALGGLVCARLPKTRSGKTLRRTIKTLVENACVGKYNADAPFPPTIEDATAVDDVRLQINEYFKAGGGKASKPKL